jgi:hypothetical protein
VAFLADSQLTIIPFIRAIQGSLLSTPSLRNNRAARGTTLHSRTLLVLQAKAIGTQVSLG